MLEEPVGCCNRSRSTSFPRNCPSPSGRNFALDPSTNWLISVKHCRCQRQLEAMNETCTVLDKKGPVPLKGRCLLLFLLMSFSVDGSGEKRPKRQTPSLRSRGCRPRISSIFPPKHILPTESSRLPWKQQGIDGGDMDKGYATFQTTEWRNAAATVATIDWPEPNLASRWLD